MKKSRVLFAAGIFALAFPFFINRRMRVFRKTVIRAKPGEIFPLLNDLRNWPLWTEWSRRSEMHVSYDGPPAGIGAVQRWDTEKMSGILRITHSTPDARIAYTLDIAGGRHHIDGLIALHPAGPLTTVTWTCKWDTGENPYARYPGMFFKGCIGRDFAAGLANLKSLIEGGR